MLAKSQTQQALPRAGDPGSARPNPPLQPLLVSIEEACQVLGVSRAWGFLHLITPGVLPTISLEGGRRRLVPYSALVEYVESQLAGAGIEVAEPPGVASGRKGR